MNRFLIVAIIAAAILSGFLALWKYGIQRDYMVYANVACDPRTESCYIGDGDGTPEFYKSVAKPAYAIERCNGWEGMCAPLSCDADDTECTVTYCDAESDPCYGPGLGE